MNAEQESKPPTIPPLPPAHGSALMHYAETKYGFDWGAAKVTRCFSDDKKGWVTLLLETPKHKEGKSLQIYVTKSGKVRIHDARGEWKAPNNEAQR